MHNIIEHGKALYWGTSEWDAEDIVSAIDIAERHHLHKPVVEQPIYNLFERHRFAPDYKVVYQNHRIGSTTWSPLASGLLTGKYKSGIPSDSRGALEGYGWLREQLTDESQLAKVSALEPIAEAMGATLAQFSIAWCLQNATLAQFSIAWCLQNPYVSTVMTGASRVSQVHENMKAMEFTDKFTPDVMREIDRVISST